MRILIVFVALSLYISAITTKPTKHRHRPKLQSNEDLYSEEISEEDDNKYVPSKVSSKDHQNKKMFFDEEKLKGQKNKQKVKPNQSDRDKLQRLLQTLLKVKEDIEVGDYDVTDYYNYPDYASNKTNNYHKYKQQNYIDFITPKYTHNSNNHKIKDQEDYDYEDEKEYDDYGSEESKSNEDYQLNSNELVSIVVKRPKELSKYFSFGEDDLNLPDLQDDVIQTRRSTAESSCQEYNDNLIKLWSDLEKHLRLSKYSTPNKSIIHNLVLIIDAYLQHATGNKNFDSKEEAKEIAKEIDIVIHMIIELKNIINIEKHGFGSEKLFIKTVFMYINPLLESRRRKPCKMLYVKNISNLIKAAFRAYLEKTASCTDNDFNSSDSNEDDNDGVDYLESEYVQDTSKETESVPKNKEIDSHDHEPYNYEGMQVHDSTNVNNDLLVKPVLWEAENVRQITNQRPSKHIKKPTQPIASLLNKIMSNYTNAKSTQRNQQKKLSYPVKKILNNLKKKKPSKKTFIKLVSNDYLAFARTHSSPSYNEYKNDDIKNSYGYQPGEKYFSICKQSSLNELLESVKQIVTEYLHDVECRKRKHNTKGKKQNYNKLNNLLKVYDKIKNPSGTKPSISTPRLKDDLKVIKKLIDLQKYNSSIDEAPLKKIAMILKKLNKIVTLKSQNITHVPVSKHTGGNEKENPKPSKELEDEEFSSNEQQSPELSSYQSSAENINDNYMDTEDLLPNLTDTDISSYLTKLKLNSKKSTKNHVKLNKNIDSQKFSHQMSIQNFSLVPVNDLALTPLFFNSFDKQTSKVNKNKQKQDKKLFDSNKRKDQSLRILMDSLHNFNNEDTNELTNSIKNNENDDSKMSTEETFEENTKFGHPPTTVNKNEEFVELTYIVKHPKLVVYQPKFLVKQKLSYKDYLKLKDKIFNNNRLAKNDVKIVKIRKLGHTTSKYETNEIETPLFDRIVSANSTTNMKNKKYGNNYSSESMLRAFYKANKSNKNQNQDLRIKDVTSSIKKARYEERVPIDVADNVTWNDNHPILSSSVSSIPELIHTYRRNSNTNQSEQYKADQEEIAGDKREKNNKQENNLNV